MVINRPGPPTQKPHQSGGAFICWIFLFYVISTLFAPHTHTACPHYTRTDPNWKPWSRKFVYIILVEAYPLFTMDVTNLKIFFPFRTFFKKKFSRRPSPPSL